MALSVSYLVALALCLAVGLASAIPQNYNVTSAESADYNSTESAAEMGFRQGRNLNQIARLLTPENISQVKNLLSGLTTFGPSQLSNVLTFNVGNLVVIALITGVALLLAPAVLGFLGINTGGAFGRSLAGLYNSYANDKNGNFTMSAKVHQYIEEFFAGYNIDAATCMQRFACSAARKSANAVRRGNPADVDNMLNNFLSSNYVNSTLGQTKFMEAVQFGKNQGSCEIEYGKCPFSWDRVVNSLSSFNPFKLPFGAATTPVPTVPPAVNNYVNTSNK